MSANAAERLVDAAPGVLPFQELKALEGRAIRPATPLTDAQLQPASLEFPSFIGTLGKIDL
ncbi:MAG: hypothetical protein KIT16_04625 [Rhodospirillaceae bacterium]|nr:hypothetical protein [Rhodospirillaceae bacterium]